MLDALTVQSARALLSPSARLLIAAAMPGGVSTITGTDWRDVHWPTLLALAAYERAESQVDSLLRKAPGGAVPDEVLQSLRARLRVAQFRSAELAESAADVGHALDATGVEGLWLKGAALAFRSPHGFAVRAMGDMDVLVSSEAHAGLRDRLYASGWRDAPAADGYDRHHHGVPLRRGGATLELHGEIFPPGHPFAASDAGAWLRRAETITHPGGRSLVLPVEWHLVHSAVHWAWSHEGAVGSWQFLHDAALLTEGWASDGPEWASVVRHATALGAHAPAGWALWASAQLTGSAVPDAVVAALRGSARQFDGVAERAWTLRAFHSPMASPSVRWSRLWWRYAMRGLGSRDRAWPWRLGRLTSRDDRAESGPTERIGLSRALGTRLQRWRRHLVRVLDS